MHVLLLYDSILIKNLQKTVYTPGVTDHNQPNVMLFPDNKILCGGNLHVACTSVYLEFI